MSDAIDSEVILLVKKMEQLVVWQNQINQVIQEYDQKMIDMRANIQQIKEYLVKLNPPQ